MAVPKRKTSKARKRSRRTHKDHLSTPSVILCSNPECGAPMLPHRACPECGTLRRRSGDIVQVVQIAGEGAESE